jgi:teichuronic acid biosynthesis glycosyltransferase TuaC
MKALIITKIFPNSVERFSSPFNRRQFAELSRLCELEVLATIPWFPGASALGRWSAAGRLASVPREEWIDGVHVRHPRFAFVPKIGHAIAGPLYAASLSATVLPYRGRVDVVLGAWAYPDGFAAVTIAEMLGVPSVVKLHGSDMNVVARMSGPRRRLQWALPRASRVVAVSKPLAERAIELGVAPERVDLVPNGIDREVFQPRDRGAARRALGLGLGDEKVVLYVGHLTEEKGAFDLLRAWPLMGSRLQQARLVFVGDGAGLEGCRALAAELGVPAHFAGVQPHDAIPSWLAAADLLCLPSWNEGMPNVVVEALACGRPVVATAVGGIPELVHGHAGTLVPAREPRALGEALVETLARSHDASSISAELARPDWAGSARLLYESLLQALGSAAREAA